MKTRPIGLVPAMILIAGVAFFFWAKDMKKSQAPVVTPAGLPVYGKVADFKLTDNKGHEFSSQTLSGKVWAAAFIFTRCAGICPLMTQKMKAVEESLRLEEDFHMVSFSVDPEHDTPPVLEAYRLKQMALGSRWHFLTGPKDEIFKLSQQHFQLGVSMIPEAERPSFDQAVRHSSKIALVDQAGQVRGYYDTQPGDLDGLVLDAQKLLKGG